MKNIMLDILRTSEDDIHTLPDLLVAIEALGRLGGRDENAGLEANECRGLQRLAGHAVDVAHRVEKMFEAAWRAAGGDA